MASSTASLLPVLILSFYWLLQPSQPSAPVSGLPYARSSLSEGQFIFRVDNISRSVGLFACSRSGSLLNARSSAQCSTVCRRLVSFKCGHIWIYNFFIASANRMVLSFCHWLSAKCPVSFTGDVCRNGPMRWQWQRPYVYYANYSHILSLLPLPLHCHRMHY